MADIPDYMRGFDVDEDWGMTAVSKPAEGTPSARRRDHSCQA